MNSMLSITTDCPSMEATIVQRGCAALRTARNRYALYVFVALLCYLLAWVAAVSKAHVKNENIDFLITDARGYYAYLPALLIHGNLDFLSLAHEQYGEELPSYVRMDLTPQGELRNKWPIGVALTLLPSFLVAHGSALGLHALTGYPWVEPNGLSLIYPLFNVAWVLAAGAAGMVLLDRLLERRYRLPGWAIAAGILTFWLGTNYAWYYIREPLLAHTVSAAWIITVAYLFDRTLDDLSQDRWVEWRWPVMVLAGSVAMVARLTNVVLLAPLAVYLLYRVSRAGRLGSLLRLTLVLLLAAAPLLIQLVIWQQMAGHLPGGSVQDIGYGRGEHFRWAEPALWQTLFSSRHGLFFWSPAYLFSAWGLGWYAVRRGGWRDPLLVCLGVGALALWYLNSAWYAWWFGPAVGGRAFLELAVLFILGFAFAYQSLKKASHRQRWIVAALLLAAVLVNASLMTLRMLQMIPHEDYLFAWNSTLGALPLLAMPLAPRLPSIIRRRTRSQHCRQSE